MSNKRIYHGVGCPVSHRFSRLIGCAVSRFAVLLAMAGGLVIASSVLATKPIYALHLLLDGALMCWLLVLEINKSFPYDNEE